MPAWQRPSPSSTPPSLCNAYGSSMTPQTSSLVSHSSSPSTRLLDPGFALTLRPMRYPAFYEMYKDAIRNTWTVEEIDFGIDLNDLRNKLSAADRHLIERLVAFF